MKQISIATMLLLGTVCAAPAQDAFDVARDLGSVLASEQACGLSFNQEAVAAFIETKVPAEDMSFARELRTTIRTYSRDVAGMSGTQKTAHCAQIDRVAKSYGFID